MSPTTIDPTSVIRATDPNLPFLASKAAIELDKMVRGVSVDTTSIHELSSILRSSFETDESNGGFRSRMDAATLTVLGQAVNQSRTGQQIVQMDKIVEMAVTVADKMLNGANGKLREDTDSLEWARDFCVALSRCAAAYRKSLMDLRPSHPFRR